MWRVYENKITGTTQAESEDVLDWDCLDLDKKSIHLVNTDATHSLYYRLLARHSQGQTAGKERVPVDWTSLAAGGDYAFDYSYKCFSSLILQLKDNSGHAGYEINYCGRG